MYLVIDNSIDGQVLFYAYLNTKWVQTAITTNQKNLLLALNEFCDSVGKQIKDLEGIAVVVGFGKFTSTRVATTMVNALALSLCIPVLAVDRFNENLHKQLANTPSGIYVSARYSAPANIGVKK